MEVLLIWNETSDVNFDVHATLTSPWAKLCFSMMVIQFGYWIYVWNIAIISRSLILDGELFLEGKFSLLFICPDEKYNNNEDTILVT